jgi:hypothetical protein
MGRMIRPALRKVLIVLREHTGDHRWKSVRVFGKTPQPGEGGVIKRSALKGLTRICVRRGRSPLPAPLGYLQTMGRAGVCNGHDKRNTGLVIGSETALHCQRGTGWEPDDRDNGKGRGNPSAFLFGT